MTGPLPASSTEVPRKHPKALEEQPKNRSVKPDGDTIKRLRIEKGWRVEDLARKARSSVKTVENVERGANVYLFTLAKFATALGVEYITLVSGSKPAPEPPKHGPTVKVHIVLSIPFDQFEESEKLSGFIELLKRVIQARDHINVLAVTDGSTVITIEMSKEDMLKLFSAYSEGKLKEMLCDELRLSGRSRFRLLAEKCQERQKRKRDIKRDMKHKRNPKS